MAQNLRTFLPYLLSQAAETAGQDFQAYYKATYGMLRTEWRVLFHIGLHGEMTAKGICRMASLHKTKVSRAVSSLEDKRFLARTPDIDDRRVERLKLTRQGQAVFDDLRREAEAFEARLLADWSEDEVRALRMSLTKLAQLPG